VGGAGRDDDVGIVNTLNGAAAIADKVGVVGLVGVGGVGRGREGESVDAITGIDAVGEAFFDQGVKGAVDGDAVGRGGVEFVEDLLSVEAALGAGQDLQDPETD